MNVYPFIEAEKAAERNVSRACELLEVSRSAYYQQRDTTLSAREVEEAELTAAIVRLHEASDGVYGSPKIHDALKDENRHHSPKRVARIMREQGLCGTTPKRFKTTTIADPEAAARADLIKWDFSIDASKLNTRWCGDFKCRRRHLMSASHPRRIPRAMRSRPVRTASSTASTKLTAKWLAAPHVAQTSKEGRGGNRRPTGPASRRAT